MSPRAAPWFHLLLAAAHGAVASGLWFLALASLPASNRGGEPFACAARSCCCADAVDCRTSCCCGSPRGAERPDRSRGDAIQAADCDGGAPRTGMLVRLPPCILDDRSLQHVIAGSDFGRLPGMQRPPSCTPTPEGPVPRADDASRLLV